MSIHLSDLEGLRHIPSCSLQKLVHQNDKTQFWCSLFVLTGETVSMKLFGYRCISQNLCKKFLFQGVK